MTDEDAADGEWFAGLARGDAAAARARGRADDQQSIHAVRAIDDTPRVA